MALASVPILSPLPADRLDDALERGPGYVVRPGCVAPAVADRALRLLNLEIMRRGLSPEDITEGARSTFFPHLRWEPDILALRDEVEAALAPRAGEEWADPQLLLRFPDEARSWPLTPHVDAPPAWAPTRRYREIAGVALSRSSVQDGCLTVWPGSHRGGAEPPVPIELAAGDVVVMHPMLGHSSTLNRGGRVRYAVYFRLLTPASH